MSFKQGSATGHRYAPKAGTYRQTKGRVGEILAGITLDQLTHELPCRFFNEVVVRSAGGTRNVQIDFVLLTTKGFFTIEVKNWSCKLYCGDASKLYWQADYNGRMQYVVSPVKQDSWHARRMEELTGSNYESLILFSGDTELFENTNPHLMLTTNLPAFITSKSDIYTVDQMKKESYKLYELVRESGR